MSPVPAIVLAAGASSRMGRPKALLPIGGRAAVEVVAETLRGGGCGEVVVVVGAHAAEIRAGARLDGVRVVDHAGWAGGRTSSIQAGLTALPPGADAVVLALVDMPYVTPATVVALLTAHGSAGPGVEAVVPAHVGRRGHPVLLRRPLFARIAALGPDDPLSAVVRAAVVDEIPVADPGVLVDLDAPGDLRA
jgi:nicotine blue oxidoreductase